MSDVHITDLAILVPQRVSMRAIAKFLGDDDGGANVASIVENAGIEEKGLAVNPLIEDPRKWGVAARMQRSLEASFQLGRAAVEQVLHSASLHPNDIGYFASCTTTSFSVPGLDRVALAVGMKPDTELASLGPMGCYGALPGLATCRNWVAFHRRPALLLCVDLFSPHFKPPPYDMEEAVILTLFGDAAAAVVLQPEQAGSGSVRIVDAEMYTEPAYIDELKVDVSGRGVEIRLSANMADAIGSFLEKPVDALLARNHLSRSGISQWVVHPAGKRILERIPQVLDLDTDTVAPAMDVIRDHGNTASTGVLAVLDRMQRTKPLKPGEHQVLMAFGPGATVWTMLLQRT